VNRRERRDACLPGELQIAEGEEIAEGEDNPSRSGTFGKWTVSG
jgi:hypothetical protein